MVVWVIVQSAWGKLFLDHSRGADPLSGRIGCMGCDCVDECENLSEKNTGNSGFMNSETSKIEG